MLAGAAFAVALTPLLAGTLMRGYFDVTPIALTVAALVAIILARTKLGFALLGLAVMTEGFPLVVAPVAIAWLLGRGERRRALEGAATMAAVILVLAAVVVALSPKGAWYAIHYQTARPLEIESSPATLLYVWDWIAGQSGHTLGSDGSINLAHRGSGFVTVLFGLLFLGTLALLTYRAARVRAPRALLLGGLAAVAAFAAFGKVFSTRVRDLARPAHRARLLLAGMVGGRARARGDCVDQDRVPEALQRRRRPAGGQRAARDGAQPAGYHANWALCVVALGQRLELRDGGEIEGWLARRLLVPSKQAFK